MLMKHGKFRDSLVVVSEGLRSQTGLPEETPKKNIPFLVKESHLSIHRD
jgi:hypothetical protein